MQVSTLSAQLGLGWELVGWYRDATSVPNGHLFSTCRQEQSIDYVIVQPPDPFPQSFKSWTGSKSQNFWRMNTQKYSTVQMFQSFSHKSKSFSFSLVHNSLSDS